MFRDKEFDQLRDMVLGDSGSLDVEDRQVEQGILKALAKEPEVGAEGMPRKARPR